MATVAGSSTLSAEEVRVLGCLLEKQVTTPDTYPLSLNAMRLACNQSTNRDPVVDFDESTIREALRRLERRGLVRMASGAGSRAVKYRHLLERALPLDGAEHALMCTLMLRGPQTPGELKQRSERIHEFADLAAVQATLERLIERGLAARLPRRPGQKEERFRQLLDAGEEAAGATRLTGSTAIDAAEARWEAAATPAAAAGETEAGDAVTAGDGISSAAGMADLERRVAELERKVAALLARSGVTQGVDAGAAIGDPMGEGS